jgi:hypothetical protein
MVAHLDLAVGAEDALEADIDLVRPNIIVGIAVQDEDARTAVGQRQGHANQDGEECGHEEGGEKLPTHNNPRLRQ